MEIEVRKDPLPALRRERRFAPSLTTLVSVSVFLAELLYGIYLGYFQGILLNDAFSRTANAFYVLFVQPPRFASIGLVWNPLPSALQLPFMWLAKFWRPIAASGIAAAAVTALAAACTAAVLMNTFLKFKQPPALSIGLTLLYALNPFLFFYGANGMSEAIFFAFMTYALCAYTLWLQRGTSKYIIQMAFALVGMFFTRYEAIPFALALGLGGLINILFNPSEQKYWSAGSGKERYFYAEGTAIVLYTPMAYAVLLWVLFNWVVTGNPLYFLNSTYSNVSQSTFTREYGSIVQILQYALQRVLPFSPLFLAILAMRALQRRLMRSDVAALCLLVLGMVGFHCVMLYIGSSFGWLRFFSMALPIAMAWLPYELASCKPEWKRTAQAVFAAALIASGLLCYGALQDDDLAKEEKSVTISQEVYTIASYINANLSENKLLMDAFLTSGVILNVDNVDNLVVSSSLDFADCVADPVRSGIEYLLLPSPSGVGNLDALNLAYPQLYEEGAEWCRLAAEFDGFRLYEVID